MSLSVSLTQHAPGAKPGATGVSCYLDEIPAFAGAELSRLYGHIHSSPAFFETSRPMDNVSTYVARADGEVSAVLVFRLADGVADVLNEFIVIDAQEVRRFADCIFATFPATRAIRFQAVQTDASVLPYPVQLHNSKENWIIALPACAAAYTAGLGKATREKIKRCTRKVARDLPTYGYEFREREAIREEDVRELIRLSQARITSKGKLFGIDEAETLRILRMAQRCGVMNLTRVDGRLCAGMITYHIGEDFLTEVIAHDPAYNDYSLGQLCYHTTVCESIARGARRFHLGGGREGYKARMLGVRQDMDRLVIHRSAAHMALNAPLAVRTAAAGGVRRAKVWMLANPDSRITRAVLTTLTTLAGLRRPQGR